MVLEKPKSATRVKYWSDSVVVTRGVELLRAEGSELVPVVGGHVVLTAFAAIECEEGGVGACAAAFAVVLDAAVFVIGMSDDGGDGGAGVELLKSLREANSSLINGERATVGGLVDGCCGLLRNGDGAVEGREEEG